MHVLAAVTDRRNRDCTHWVGVEPDRGGPFWHKPPPAFMKDRDFMLSEMTSH